MHCAHTHQTVKDLTRRVWNLRKFTDWCDRPAGIVIFMVHN